MNEDKKSVKSDSLLSDQSVDSEKEIFKKKYHKALSPLPGDNTVGEYLRYETIYDRIQDARIEEDKSIPQGVWERDHKKADWHVAKSTCIQALETMSKDLQIAVWLLESLLHIEGFSGVKDGISILSRLCERFWGNIHPELEEGDMDARLSPFIWMNEKLSIQLKFIQITMPKTEDSHPYNFPTGKMPPILKPYPKRTRNYLNRKTQKTR